MIIFDGEALENLAPVRIEDIRVGGVELSPVARPHAIAPGADFVRMNRGTRNIAITFAIQDQDRNQRSLFLQNVSMWAKTDKEYKLELPQYPDLYLMAVCTSKPEPSYRQWWEGNLRIVFSCISDPFWVSSAVRSVECGTDFFVQGDDTPIMWIERTLSSAASNQSYTLDGRTMTFSSIPAGKLVIDLNNQTAKVGTSSIMANYAVNSDFLIPRNGSLKVYGTGTVKFRERWQ